eukprot:gene18318-46186_t
MCQEERPDARCQACPREGNPVDRVVRRDRVSHRRQDQHQRRRYTHQPHRSEALP